MKFRTIVELPKYNFNITHNTNCVFTGSCFAENIGNKILETKIPTLINPLGIHYNPLSLAKSLKFALNNTKITDTDLFNANGLWNSYHFHSKFSNTDKNKCISTLNNAITNYHLFIKNTDYLFITFGTAYVYELLEDNTIVSNCHKQPENKFKRRLLSIQEIIESWTEIITKLLALNPNLHIVFTVSPIRHLRDGATNNQISKGSLIIAINDLCKLNKQLTYFPSYEIVNDELRDYRFYANDMIHPSELAIKYIMEKFSEAFFSSETISIINRILKIVSASKHRVFNKKTEKYNEFKKKTLEEIKKLEIEFSNLNLKDLKEQFI